MLLQGELAWGTKTLERAAHKGRIGSPKAAASILCGQAAVPPSPGTTQRLQTLISAPILYGEEEAMHKQRDRGRRLEEERPLVVANKQVIAGALNLHAAASPGPGGFRNSYIQAVAEYPGGAEALRRWCNMVAGGNMPAASTRLWNAAMLRPFFKSDGVAIRPATGGEALFKFAMAVCFAARSKQVSRALGPDQFGSRKQDGAGQMVAQVSAALTLAPMDAVVCTVAKNVVGSILRSTLWKAALDACPKLAGVLQHLFGAGPTRMWAEQESGGYQCLEMHRGTGHGGPESMPLYCLAAAKQCERLQAFARSQAIVMRQWMFVDDFIFQAAPEAVPQLVAEYERICGLDEIILARGKCKAYWPAYAQASRLGDAHMQQWAGMQRSILAAMAGAVQIAPERITVLGSAVGGRVCS